MSGQSSLRSEASPDRSLCLLLDVREMVQPGHRLHLPVVEEGQGQDEHEYAGAEQGGHGGRDQHDPHSLAVSGGVGGTRDPILSWKLTFLHSWLL